MLSRVADVSLDELIEEISRCRSAAEDLLGGAADAAAVERARVELLGARSGRLKAIQKSLSAVDPSQRRDAGRHFNELKDWLAAALAAAQERVAARPERVVPIDVTLPGAAAPLGHVHPITQTIRRVEEIMARLGFESVDGPEVEDQWHNFDALAIPPEHPARDPLDNFFLAVARGAEPLLLRSQTSTVQIRVMERRRPPLRIVSLGRVYRPDAADATHYPMFHQIEGLMVDRRVTLADLKTVLKLFATNYLGSKVPIRIRPSFFPFTEPSVEADYFWNGRWVEFGGAGMVDPNVFAAVGYDPEEYSGFAFGLGIERLCMIRHQITDIRHLFTNDVRFLRQF